jgi:excisionase family DNA binding protein
MKVDKLLDVHEAAQRLSLSPFGIYRRVQTGDLPVVRIGRLLRFSSRDLELWIKRKKSQVRRHGGE